MHAWSLFGGMSAKTIIQAGIMSLFGGMSAQAIIQADIMSLFGGTVSSSHHSDRHNESFWRYCQLKPSFRQT